MDNYLHLFHIPSVVGQPAETSLCVEHGAERPFDAGLFHAHDEELVGDQGFPQSLTTRLSHALVKPVNEELDGVRVEVNDFVDGGVVDVEGEAVLEEVRHEGLLVLELLVGHGALHGPVIQTLQHLFMVYKGKF